MEEHGMEVKACGCNCKMQRGHVSRSLEEWHMAHRKHMVKTAGCLAEKLLSQECWQDSLSTAQGCGESILSAVQLG